MSKTQENIHYEYGCLDKKYFVSFYINSEEKQDRIGCTNEVYGTIENFQPHGHTAIKDIKGDMWLIDSSLVEVMRPVNDLELRKWSVLSSKKVTRGKPSDYYNHISCKRLFEVSDIFVIETDFNFVVIKNRKEKDVYAQDFVKVQKLDFAYRSDIKGFENRNIIMCL